MRIDHIAINAVNLEEEISFLVDFLGLKLLQKWDKPKQAYVGFDDGPVFGVIENPSFDNTVYTMAHIAFNVPEDEFEKWVTKIQDNDVEVVAGPKDQRGGMTILFRTPSKNIIEICYPYVRESIASQTY
jgi:catechol 2,3-dioxygenase-like lactoylglutathione lyase family enzyme